MVYHLLICRSLTYAQRTLQVLNRAGIGGRILRTPRDIADEGCSHSVKIAQRDLSRALMLLQKAGISPESVYTADESGGYREVER